MVFVEAFAHFTDGGAKADPRKYFRSSCEERARPARGVRASRLHAAQPDSVRAQSRRARLSGCGARADQLRHRVAAARCVPQLGRGARARLVRALLGKSEARRTPGWRGFRGLLARLRVDGIAAAPEGARHLRAHQLSRRQTQVPRGHAALHRLCPCSYKEVWRACPSRAIAGRGFVKAMLLAAGRGERLRPLTDSVPKAMVEAGGKPLIAWHLERLETAGGIAQARQLLGPEPFLLLNADVYCEYDLARLLGMALGTKLAHLILVPNPAHRPRGDFGLVSDYVKSNAGPRYTYAGVALVSPQLVQGVKPGEKASLAPLLYEAADRSLMTGELYRGLWQDVGTCERLAELETLLESRHENR